MYSAGGLTINFELRTVAKRGLEIRLSPKEFDVLALLARANGAPLPHGEILRKVWGFPYGGELAYLRTYIRLLRAKLEDQPKRPQYVITEPWFGYRLLAPSDPAD